MKKFIYILPLLVVLFFQKENFKIFPSQEKPKAKVTDTIKKDSVVEKLEMYHKGAHASYYANKFNGRRTASGTKFNNNDMTCAHRKLPFGTKLKITGVKTKKVVYVTVTDRGPFVKTKHIDLTKAAFDKVKPKAYGGHIEVDIEIVKK
ncbi:septal ring lytic transglycosylase RlpA family protein [Flavobacterium urocaniciphilum]|uniref:Rare lipoprotein A n=1 Tax=Flavobacterium urocaniciphilum TaxID=1299341 RepID=A0A1H9BK01_9FLAO|nr:septal ring lytic transglycosylase RlpA family protein [Flavobacterium urocaniciphilum]SEP89245.1 rare lipoprotein A [Flavobacterium urocaniciphilum]